MSVRMMKGLIAYGTRYGSTGEISQRMGEILSEAGIETKVVDLGKDTVSSVSEYDLVIVGSGIRVGKWTKEAFGFLERHEAELSGKKVALFVSCGDVRDPEKRDEAKENYLVKVAETYPSVKPVQLGLFGGVFNMRKYGFGVKLLMKALTKDLKEQGVDLSEPYDFRDWEEIQKWTSGLLDQG